MCQTNQGFGNGIAVFVLAKHNNKEGIYFQLFSNKFMENHIITRWYQRDYRYTGMVECNDVGCGIALLHFWMDMLLAQRTRPLRIIEFGFERGCTAIAFLELCPSAVVVSIDRAD